MIFKKVTEITETLQLRELPQICPQNVKKNKQNDCEKAKEQNSLPACLRAVRTAQIEAGRTTQNLHFSFKNHTPGESAPGGPN